MNKSDIRTELKRERLALSAQERRDLSNLIRQNLSQLDWSKIKTIHCFEPITKLNEVDITGFITGRTLYTSRLIDGEWQVVSMSDSSTPPTEFDAVVVPMLGFDSDLNRIGYGGGYYDRLLAKQKNAIKIGVCYESGKVEHIPAEAHDIPMDIIVTETSIYR